MSDREIRNRVLEILKYPFLDRMLDKGHCIGDFDHPAAPKNKQRWHRMVLRYFVALKYAEDKTVLDTCSGLGWGGYILSTKAISVTGVEINPSLVSMATKEYRADNLSFRQGNALLLEHLESQFDLVTAMESIEHFSFEEGQKYLISMTNSLAKKGVLILSSYFAKDNAEAKRVCSKVISHKYIWTSKEITDFLERYFSSVQVIDSTICICKNKYNEN